MKYSVLRKFFHLCLVFAGLFSAASAATKELDTYFGNNGFYMFPTGQTNSNIRALDIQPDEKIVMAGYSADGPQRSNRFPTLERLLPNGMPDPSFGSGGAVVFPFAGEFESLVIQPDGKLLMAGTVFSRGDTGSRYLVVRCNPDGSLDTAFNGTGIINGYFERRARFSYADEILLRPDGRIIVAGSSKTTIEIFGVAQFDTNGSVDTSFGASGVSLIPNTRTRHVESALLQPDGKIVLAGLSNFTLARLQTDGSLDASFGNGGISFALFNTYSEAKSIKLQPDGKIVGAGWSMTTFGGPGYLPSNCIVARYNPNGTPDTSFGTGGRYASHFTNYEYCYDVEIQPNGKIIAVSIDTLGNYPSFKVRRLHPNGTEDIVFDGRLGTDGGPFVPMEESNVVKLQRDGKILIAGGTTGASHVALRFGSSLKSFDFDGDGKSDASCFRPSNSTWNVLSTEFAATSSTHWGLPTDTLVPADYDGDGKTNIAVFRDGAWKVLWYDQTYHNILFGQTGDIPRPGDFDGDGKSDLALWRPSNGNWYWINSSDGQLHGLHFGVSTDLPLIADFDGDRKADAALFRPSNANWLYLESSTGRYIARPFGIPGDTPVPADYNGDGKTELAVYNGGNGYWHRINTYNGQVYSKEWGMPGDIPAPADFDGDGWTDLVVFRPSNNTWCIFSPMFTTAREPIQFCQAGDRPVPSVFQP